MHGLDGSLARLGLKTIDLYYVHFPLPLMDCKRVAEAVQALKRQGMSASI
jgi:aryl-alcohol dehydrogenase-like predicted oxidoreductase